MSCFTSFEKLLITLVGSVGFFLLLQSCKDSGTAKVNKGSQVSKSGNLTMVGACVFSALKSSNKYLCQEFYTIVPQYDKPEIYERRCKIVGEWHSSNCPITNDTLKCYFPSINDRPSRYKEIIYIKNSEWNGKCPDTAVQIP